MVQHAVRAAAVVVEGPGDEFLAGSALAGDQHRGLGIGDPLHYGEHLLQLGALADDAVELVLGTQLAVEHAILGLEAAVFDSLLHETSDHIQALLLEGLLEVPECAGAQRFDGVLGAAVAGDHDAGQIGGDVADLPYQLQPVDARHLDVAQHQINWL